MQSSLLKYQESNKKERAIDGIINKFKYGQYFTKDKVVRTVIKLILDYKPYKRDISILEPSFGSGNFIRILKENGFKNISGCEIDPQFTHKPSDFFELSLNNKFDLIIGNPPFTKYNVPESYYYAAKYLTSKVMREKYLINKLVRKEKEKIENIFILKSLKHIKNSDSTIGFVLPISFFIKNRNKEIKEEILKNVSTIIVYQNDKIWFDYHIPCCFAIFTNTERYKDKIIVKYENSEIHETVFDITKINEELIPEVIFNKNNGSTIQKNGRPLKEFISKKVVNCRKSFEENNVSAKNILDRKTISKDSNIIDYKLAIVRVGNSSVGKAGLINIKKDILNDMFYVFEFNKEYMHNKEIKESICEEINKNQEFFKNITCRVGSKSIKKEDVYDFKVDI